MHMLSSNTLTTNNCFRYLLFCFVCLFVWFFFSNYVWLYVFACRASVHIQENMAFDLKQIQVSDFLLLCI